MANPMASLLASLAGGNGAAPDLMSALTGGGGASGASALLQGMMGGKMGGGDTSDAVKTLLRQKLQGTLAGIPEGDPRRKWITDALEGKPVDKQAILAANPGLLAGLAQQNPQLYQALVSSDPTLAGHAPQPQAAPSAKAPPTGKTAPAAMAELKDQFWGHIRTVGAAADKATQTAQSALGAAQVAAQTSQATSQEVRELRAAVEKLAAGQQDLHSTLRDLAKTFADTIHRPAQSGG